MSVKVCTESSAIVLDTVHFIMGDRYERVEKLHNPSDAVRDKMHTKSTGLVVGIIDAPVENNPLMSVRLWLTV